MKITAIALTLILALLASLMAGMQTVEVAQAQFFGRPFVWTDSPSSTEVYTNTTIPLKVYAIIHIDAPDIVHFLYCVDENSNVTLTNLNKAEVGIHPSELGYEFYASSVLENLIEGNHTLKLYSFDVADEWMSYSVEFMVDTHFKSPLLVVSPKNRTYTTSEVDVTFVCGEEIRFADYQLNGRGDPLYENFTLSGLSIGEHKLKVVVWTVRGVFSQTLYFSISQPEPIPTILVIASVAIVVIVGFGIFAYSIKKRTNKK